MEAGFFQNEWSTRKQGRSHSIIYDLTLEVTISFHGFSSKQRTKSLIELHEPVLFTWEGTTQGWEYEEAGTVGDSFGADYHHDKSLIIQDAFVC